MKNISIQKRAPGLRLYFVYYFIGLTGLGVINSDSSIACSTYHDRCESALARKGKRCLDFNSLFDYANQFYDQEDYQSAAGIYDQIRLRMMTRTSDKRINPYLEPYFVKGQHLLQALDTFIRINQPENGILFAARFQYFFEKSPRPFELRAITALTFYLVDQTEAGNKFYQSLYQSADVLKQSSPQFVEYLFKILTIRRKNNLSFAPLETGREIRFLQQWYQAVILQINNTQRSLLLGPNLTEYFGYINDSLLRKYANHQNH